MKLQDFAPLIGFLFLIASAVTEYQYNKPQPLPGHHAGFFLACDSIPARKGET